MNAVEIEEAISALAEEPFDPVEFPYQFLFAFGNKETTIKRLRKGSTNQSDLDGGLLQRNNIHIKTCQPDKVGQTLSDLVASSATSKQKVKYALATDGQTIEAENLVDGETLACEYSHLGDHFGFFLALAGIATVKPIRDNAFDIKATGRMNRLYVELQNNNPDWDTAERREELNQFFARLIFCFFAEDTGIFPPNNIFTSTVQKMSEPGASNTHEIISEVFRAMNINKDNREGAGLPRYTAPMPYVNGGLFEASTECPKFTKIARSYFIHIGGLDWTKINPDIFGSMIQAVTEDEERGELGMHYTSVPNILKVLDPLFMDELRQQLDYAGDNTRKLLNLRNRIARIRVFDPACGSGNFLVIAYKEMRGIEAEINRRRGEFARASDIPLTNFRGIEMRSFAAEVARLALVIAQFQCDLRYLGPRLALPGALPLSKENWITCGNALQINWVELCPPTSKGVRLLSDDLFASPLDQSEIDFANEGGETFICGNPPYKGSQIQTKQQKSELRDVFAPYDVSPKQIDYIGGWIVKTAEYLAASPDSNAGLVSTNSVNQGRIVPLLWPIVEQLGSRIHFARTSFKWSNLASHNAGVTVVVIGLSTSKARNCRLYEVDDAGEESLRVVDNINGYLFPGEMVYVKPRKNPINGLPPMAFGNMPIDGGGLLLNKTEFDALNLSADIANKITRRIYGSAEFIDGTTRHCLWIKDADLPVALANDRIARRIDRVREFRLASRDKGTKSRAEKPHQMREMQIGKNWALVIPSASSEKRPFLPAGIIDNRSTVTNLAFSIYDTDIWPLAVISSRLHVVWIASVCGRLETRYRYSNTLGWNTFPMPLLTRQAKAALNESGRRILLARESYWPATIAEMYGPERMDAEFPRLREAHKHNDEVLERIYIGRRFKNDTERLEKLFEMYTTATAKEASA